MNSYIYRCSNISKSFKQGNMCVEVLRSINFSLETSKSLAILGSSGSGKTTLLHLLAGLDIATSGNILYKEKEMGNLDVDQRAVFRNKEMGFVYQFHHLLPEFDAMENVALPIQMAGSNVEKAQREAKELLNQVGLSKRFNHLPGQLSGGERQRVAVARALANSPSCLIMDEPTGDLDIKNAKTTVDLIINIVKERSLSLIIATHDMNLANRLDDTLHLELDL